MTDKREIDSNRDETSVQSLPVSAPPECDVDQYRKHLKGMDLNDREEAELIRNLWQIMAAFVDLGFGLDSVQLISDSKDKLGLINIDETENTISEGVNEQ